MKKDKVHFYQAFDATVRRFNLDIDEISQSSGVPLSRLALFRGGFDTRIDTVEKLIATIPSEAKSHFMNLVLDAKVTA